MDQRQQQAIEQFLGQPLPPEPSNAEKFAEKFGGRYGLVHPNTEAVYSATQLWFLFSEEPPFRRMLDDLYPQVNSASRLRSEAPSLRIKSRRCGAGVGGVFG